MTSHYRRHRSDANRREIVDALRQAGALVFDIGEPFDLLVRAHHLWHVLEIKNPNGLDRLTPAQRSTLALLDAYGGSTAIVIVRTPLEALQAVGFVR